MIMKGTCNRFPSFYELRPGQTHLGEGLQQHNMAAVSASAPSKGTRDSRPAARLLAWSLLPYHHNKSHRHRLTNGTHPQLQSSLLRSLPFEIREMIWRIVLTLPVRVYLNPKTRTWAEPDMDGEELLPGLQAKVDYFVSSRHNSNFSFSWPCH